MGTAVFAIHPDEMQQYYDEHKEALGDEPVIMVQQEGSEWYICLGQFNQQPFVFAYRPTDLYSVGKFVADGESVGKVVMAFALTYYGE